MITGRVTATRKPIVRLTILDSAGIRRIVPVIIDTGFTGQLALPPRYVNRLGLVVDDAIEGRPVTGEFMSIPAGDAVVIWQSQQRGVKFLQVDSEPLLGMQFLWNYHIGIDALTGGPVTVTPLAGYQEQA